ncbi:MAG: coproporphyrinogen III oxidase-like Fe-S oxidoreductase [Paraglaciecola sp.]|jgi:coproporphyrinogen III oxidase-like Fe-S oxidoreductase
MFEELYPVTYYFYPLLPHEKRVQDILDPCVRGLQEVFMKPRVQVDGALLYLHIPYCHDICQFCPFHVRVDNDESIYQRYTDYLCKEMELLSQQRYIQDMTFTAVYFGGGSPSIFPVSQLKQILEAMNRFFNITKNAEISFEGEPKTLGDPHRLDLLKEFNVSRISFGLQTYDDKIRELFKIKATLADVENVRVNGRARDFADINVDMMYDLPGQNLESLNQDMERLLEDDYDSVDYYNLHYFAFPKKFKLDMANGKIAAKPDALMHLALTEKVTEFMTGNGYNHVADQVFSKGEVCDYFKLLWAGGYGEHKSETVAVGASARGYLDGYSYLNRSNVRDYFSFLDRNTLPLQKVSNRLEQAHNRGTAFFLKFFSLDKQRHPEAMSNIPPPLLKTWKQYGLLHETEKSLNLTAKGKLWIPNMMVDLFEPEQKLLATGSKDLLTQKQGSRTGSF